MRKVTVWRMRERYVQTVLIFRITYVFRGKILVFPSFYFIKNIHHLSCVFSLQSGRKRLKMIIFRAGAAQYMWGPRASHSFGALGRPIIWPHFKPINKYIYTYIFNFRVRTGLTGIFKGACQNGRSFL